MRVDTDYSDEFPSYRVSVVMNNSPGRAPDATAVGGHAGVCLRRRPHGSATPTKEVSVFRIVHSVDPFGGPTATAAQS